MVTVWRTVLLLSCYNCDSTHQHYDVTQFEYVLWRHTMHERVMNIHYKTWIAQGRFTNMILTPSKRWGVCDNVRNIMRKWVKGFSYDFQDMSDTTKEKIFRLFHTQLDCFTVSYVGAITCLLVNYGKMDEWIFMKNWRYVSHDRKYKDYVYRKMLVQEYLKK